MYVKLMRRSEQKMNEWAKHWQCDSEAQGMEDEPWRTEELSRLEEGAPRLKEESMEKRRGFTRPLLVKALTGFTPKFR